MHKSSFRTARFLGVACATLGIASGAVAAGYLAKVGPVPLRFETTHARPTTASVPRAAALPDHDETIGQTAAKAGIPAPASTAQIAEAPTPDVVPTRLATDVFRFAPRRVPTPAVDYFLAMSPLPEPGRQGLNSFLYVLGQSSANFSNSPLPPPMPPSLPLTPPPAIPPTMPAVVSSAPATNSASAAPPANDLLTITPQMLVDYFKPASTTNGLDATVVVPVEFTPPPPPPALPGSSATYKSQ